MKKKIKNIIIFILILIATIMIIGSLYYYKNYPEQTFDQILFYLFSGVEHTSVAVVNSVIKACLKPVVIIAFLIWLPTKRIIKTSNYITIKIRKKTFKIKIFPFDIIRLHRGIYLTIIYIISILLLIFCFKIDKYIYNNFQETTIYEEHYVNGQEIEIKFPEQKRNLIIIVAESMENTLFSQENGGGWQYSVMPELEELAKENINFSNTELIGGGIQISGTDFTAAGMVSLTAGIPLKIANPNDYNGKGKYLDSAYTLGDILKEQGYNLEIMMGSDGTFGGRKQYFSTNGGYKIFDLNYAIDTGKMSTAEKVWWGFEDDKLFEWSKEEITNLANKEEPFNYIMLTADTHFVDGYLSQNAENKFETQYENVYAYSSKSIYEFVQWIKEQDFYENTTVVIVGDHLGMQTEFYEEHTGEGYKRTIYNCFINSAIPATNTNNRLYFHVDLFPTILASIGVQIEGNRLGLGTNLFSNKPTLMEELGFQYVNAEIQKKSRFYNNTLLGEDYYIQQNLDLNEN